MMPFARVSKSALRPEVLRDLPPTACKVLLVLADCLESKADCGRISVRAIEERTGLKRRAVQLALRALGDAGVIERYGQRGEFRYLPDPGGAPSCAPAHRHAPPGASSCAEGRTTVREGAHAHAPTVGRNKERPRTLNQELSTNNSSSSSAQTVYPKSQLEIDQDRVHRAIEILNEQTDPRTGKPVWRPYTNQVRKLAQQWVLENRRDPEELPALVAYAAGKANGALGAYAARIIDAGDWDPEQAEQRNGSGGGLTQFEADDPALAISGLSGGNA